MKHIAIDRRVTSVLHARTLVPPMTGALLLILLVVLGSQEMIQWAFEELPTLLFWSLIAAALYVIPGFTVLKLLWPDLARPAVERLALASGIGVALPPLLLEIAHLIGLPWSGPTTLAYVILMALPLVAPWLVSRTNIPPRAPLQLSWQVCLIAGLLVVALVTRLYIVRDLPVGMWGDSYHHTMIAQLLVENRGLFSSWEPYAPLVTFTYHFGFHANAAFFHWLSGVPIPQAVIVVGQFLSTATLLVAYGLTRQLTGSRSAGLWAIALTGFINTQPIYFVNWGRYTQLAGQVILPIVLICWMVALERRPLTWRSALITACVTAGLALTHYIVTIFAALFLGIYILARMLREPTWRVARDMLLGASVVGAITLVLIAPWVWNTTTGYLSRNAAGFINKTVESGRIETYSTLTAITPFYLKSSIMALAALGVVIAVALRQWMVALAALWSQGLILLVAPHLVGLPGAGIVNNFTAYIALYLTAIPLAAYTLGVTQDRLQAWRPHIGSVVTAGLIIAASIWGTNWQQRLLDRSFQLFTDADLQAMRWIRDNTSPDALFLVNMFPAYGETLVAGSDGGWWIPLLTERRTTLPPITYGSERAASEDYSTRIRDFAAALREHPLPSEEGISLCREAGIDYVYSGAHSGQEDRIDVEALRRHPAFRVVYDRSGVVIFALGQAP